MYLTTRPERHWKLKSWSLILPHGLKIGVWVFFIFPCLLIPISCHMCTSTHSLMIENKSESVSDYCSYLIQWRNNMSMHVVLEDDLADALYLEMMEVIAIFYLMVGKLKLQIYLQEQKVQINLPMCESIHIFCWEFLPCY